MATRLQSKAKMMFIHGSDDCEWLNGLKDILFLSVPVVISIELPAAQTRIPRAG
jgi:hypothetical protein